MTARRAVTAEGRLDAASAEDARHVLDQVAAALVGSNVQLIANPNPRHKNPGRPNSQGCFWHFMITVTEPDPSEEKP